jgi:hypothetical protein
LALCLARKTGLQIARRVASLAQAPPLTIAPRDTAIEFFDWSRGPACVS